jgi:D-glycero-beta-D-manno-heptose 1-phosphate adenylyltransferase
VQVLGQVVSQRELLARRGEWKRTGKGVVCAYGVFDLLHPGHVRLLEQARDSGEIVVVAVQSDVLARAAAAEARHVPFGEGATTARPITPAAERAEILAALRAVDLAAVVDEPRAQFLQIFRPDVFVCGDEPAGASPAPDMAHRELEAVLAEMGCKFVRLPLEPGYSTTRLIERISGGRG